MSTTEFTYPLHFPTSTPQPLLTLTHSAHIWTIELHNGPDNRLTEQLIRNAFMPALDMVERHWRVGFRRALEGAGKKDKKEGAGALIIVGRRDQDKFFSNGLDFERIAGDPNFFPYVLNPFLARLLAFPIPTIAAINGHCFAAGMMTVLACDYRVMTDGRARNAWMSMNEIHFGAPWPPSFAGILRAKLPSHALVRAIALEGRRFTPADALKAGIIDRVVPSDAGAGEEKSATKAPGAGTARVLAVAEEIARGIMENASTGVWGLIKADLYRDTLAQIGLDLRQSSAQLDDKVAKTRL